MNENVDANGFPWFEMMESTAGLWLSAAQGWQDMIARACATDSSRSEDYVQASISMWRAFLSPWGGMGPSVAKGNGQLDMIEALLQVMGHGAMSQEISKLLLGKIPGAGFENMQQDAVRAWTDIYEKVVQPLLKAPRVGLTRVFQEKIGHLADKFNTYQTTVSEFQMLLSGPMDKAFADTREELERIGAKGKSEDDYRTYYGMWIKSLEGHYMTLFRSEEYRTALSRLLDETAAFRISGNDVLTEVLQFLPIPTNKEMDDLYLEMYTLKKTMKEATKKIKKLESALAEQTMFPQVGNMAQGGLK